MHPLRTARFIFLLLIFSLPLSAFAGNYSDEKHNLSSAYETFHKTKDFDVLSYALEKYVESDYFSVLKNQKKSCAYVKTVKKLLETTQAAEKSTEADKIKYIEEINYLFAEAVLAENSDLSASEKTIQEYVVIISVLVLALLGFLVIFSKTQEKVRALKLKSEKEKAENDTIVRVQENERKRIYQELHDTVVQDIRVNLMYLSQLEEMMKQSQHDDANSLLQKITEIEKKNQNQTRAIINNLVPPEIKGTDFKTSLLDLCAMAREQGKADVNIFISPEVDFANFAANHSLTEQKKLNIYRIIQEAMNNTQKHADATEISVIIKLDEAKENLQIFITDDGKGFNVNENKNDGQVHLGLKGMSARASSIGGKITIDSSEETGTEIKVVVPVQNFLGGGRKKRIELNKSQ